ncbi:alkane 1-monooxygenase [Microbulbifer sp. Q7]|uniref:alkane 1-monooxygenase n=1 Tax=Microbulbifer sp. Q7 TaxID=1785091 RepID=UPI000829E05B|nr:alkane 1-monooxygenase [Microbulbifer sp. Q7]
MTRTETPISRGRALRYAFAYLLPIIVCFSLLKGGFWLAAPLLYLYGVLPLAEWLLPQSTRNLPEDQEAHVAKDPLYDLPLLMALPVQCGVLVLFFSRIPGYAPLELLGGTLSVGLMCGVFGINVGHELGHRADRLAQRVAQALLMSSLYTHFFIEHNRGHHRHVATPEDPASARYNEPLYRFWWRSITSGYISAWQLEAERLRKLARAPLGIHNQMLQFQLAQLLLLAAILATFGPVALVCFIGAATIGILMLETVNYIEHYGLCRATLGQAAIGAARYERVQPRHSWNSDHWLGRLSLFELTRHSDHHFRASRRYQILRHHDDSPQLPAGYPAMMLLACVPPAWFRVMNPRVDAVRPVPAPQ